MNEMSVLKDGPSLGSLLLPQPKKRGPLRVVLESSSNLVHDYYSRVAGFGVCFL
jgi:riboflavin biosynthesis pyrimidine reductase